MDSSRDRAESAGKDEKVENPALIFATPSQLIKDRTMSEEEQRAALDNWEHDDRALMTASDEGMRETSHDEGGDDRLDEVMLARLRLSGEPTAKPCR